MQMENKGTSEVSNIKKIVPIPSSGKFFRAWLEVLKPLHHLTDREIDLLAAFVQKRYELQRTILNPNMVDSILMTSASKAEIRKSVGISTAYLHNMMAKFKKNKVLLDDPNIRGGRINPQYIPPLSAEDKELRLLFIFVNPNDY